MKPHRLLILCLWAVSLTLAACAPTPTPFPFNPATSTALPAVPEIPPAAPATATPVPTETPSPTLSITPTALPTALPTHTLPPSPTPTITRTSWPGDLPGLNSLARKRDMWIGAVAQVRLLTEDSKYGETFLKEFNIIAPDQEMSICVVWPERKTWNFEASDALMKFAQDNQLRVRARGLVGDGCIPDWITTGKFNPVEASDILEEYISTMVGRYKGRIAYWDVLNNTLEEPPIWASLIGANYAELAFKWAHAADPRAKLFYSDDAAEVLNKKSDLQYDFLKGLQYRNVPINGLGMQMHLNARIEKESVAQNIKRINELGLEVHITEFSIDKIDGLNSADELQAMLVQDMLTVCLKAKNCPVFMLWGFTDKYPHSDHPDANPLIFDDQYQPKPAYEALYLALK